ncbi:MAG: hypothetical protein ACXW6T_07420, partial [Candidatus Binatia bacterium]
MLNSLQGLKQRLDDFSITDVTNAEANAHTLILRLRQFQDTIAAVALLKNATVNVSRSIAEIAPFDTDVVNLDSLENHPQLHAIVKASKLIKLRKLMTALKAGAEVGESQKDQFHNNVAAVLPTVELIANRPNESLDATVRESSEGDLTSLPAMVDESAAALQSIETNATNPSITVVSTVFASPINATLREFTGIEATPPDSQAQTDFPTAEAEFETAVVAVIKTPSLAEAVLLEDFAAPAEQF